MYFSILAALYFMLLFVVICDNELFCLERSRGVNSQKTFFSPIFCVTTIFQKVVPGKFLLSVLEDGHKTRCPSFELLSLFLSLSLIHYIHVLHVIVLMYYRLPSPKHMLK